jgi:hypothetical protein
MTGTYQQEQIFNNRKGFDNLKLSMWVCTHNHETKKIKNVFECPFYIRYMVEDENDNNSPFYLSDFNIAHNHPLMF